MKLTVVILTKNEERHIARAMRSVSSIATQIVVVDSGSTDLTIDIARAAGAKILRNDWINYAEQFNWAIDNLPADTDWILRLDADEIVTDGLAREIEHGLSGLADNVGGVVVSRRMTFLGRPIRWGGLFPVKMLRVIRSGRGRCENKWMDEHLIAQGLVVTFSGEIVDDNLNTLSWWTAKHNNYASREVVDILIREHTTAELGCSSKLTSQARCKRWAKNVFYGNTPLFARAFIYFIYRYVVRFGFLDGYEGLVFHVLQGFWYRFLVDAKLHEVRHHMKRTGSTQIDAIRTVLGIELKLESQ
jgi:glycosyltransferase involved in cell wall biosynthesis